MADTTNTMELGATVYTSGQDRADLMEMIKITTLQGIHQQLANIAMVLAKDPDVIRTVRESHEIIHSAVQDMMGQL